MAAPRAATFLARRTLVRSSRQIRHLHMTGPTTSPTTLRAAERPVLNLPHTIAGLRAECKTRKIEHSGSKQEMISRLHAHELSQSRAFSAAADQSQRPTPTHSSPSHPVRHFNTTRPLQAMGDNSTIDFAYLPISYNDPEPISPELFRVPILPNNFTTKFNSEPEDQEVMKPEISTMSADAVFSPMAESTDGHGIDIDFHAMADRVAQNLKTMKVPADEQAGLMKQIWSDLVDDMIGKRKKGGS